MFQVVSWRRFRPSNESVRQTRVYSLEFACSYQHVAIFGKDYFSCVLFDVAGCLMSIETGISAI